MTTTDSTTPNYCASCKEKIHPEARKCPSCGSFQNWRRHLGLSSSFLSVLLALISVSTVFTTVVVNTGKLNDSDIRASLISWQRLENYSADSRNALVVEVMLTNTGQRPGIVKNVSVKSNHFDKFLLIKKDLRSQDGSITNALIIEPGNTVLLKRFLKTYGSEINLIEKYTNASLQITVTNFSQTEQTINIAINNREPILYR